MATWITHLMVADRVLERVPRLDKKSFCVGNIAPDCNVENKDWTHFVPSREITHWMSSDRKTSSDCERFYQEYIENRNHLIGSEQEKSFLLGYYTHLVVDAEFQRFIRDTERVAISWKRIKEHPVLSVKAKGMPENWESVKKLINKNDRLKDIYTIEADFLEQNPTCSYLTEIIGLKEFPDYIDYLPKGAIVRKIGVMGYLPNKQESAYSFIAMTREEYNAFLDRTTELVIQGICFNRIAFALDQTGANHIANKTKEV